MSYRITVVPASTRAGKETIRALLEDESKPSVHGIYRDLSKVPSEFAEDPNFKALQGDITDGSSLDFGSSDAVFYIPPPTYDENTTQADHATKTANNIKAALKEAPSVKKLLIFSSIGAEYDHGIVRTSWAHIPVRIQLTIHSGNSGTESYHRQNSQRLCGRSLDCATGLLS